MTISAISSNHTASTPGAINNFQQNYNHNGTDSTHDGTDQLLQQFNAGLADHKKKSMSLIQNFLAANTKFEEFTEHFMTKINPIIKTNADRHREEVPFSLYFFSIPIVCRTQSNGYRGDKPSDQLFTRRNQSSQVLEPPFHRIYCPLNLKSDGVSFENIQSAKQGASGSD